MAGLKYQMLADTQMIELVSILIRVECNSWHKSLVMVHFEFQKRFTGIVPI